MSRNSIFGWDLPPSCTGYDLDEATGCGFDPTVDMPRCPKCKAFVRLEPDEAEPLPEPAQEDVSQFMATTRLRRRCRRCGHIEEWDE